MTHIHDIVQIGYGPVGQTSAALLGQAGHDVAVFERHSGLYALPRAGHIDHEIARIFQSIGAADQVMVDAFRCATYGWRNQHGETLIDIDWSRDGVSGWASDYLMYQPYVEEALDKAVRKSSNVTVSHGWEATDIVQHDDHVEVTLVEGRLDQGGVYRHSGESRSVRGRYLIGSDGANSITRTKANIEFDDLGFREQWLVVDFRQKRPLSFAFDNGQICDPARPMCLFQLGKSHRRFEFMVLPGEDPDMLASKASVWALVSGWLSQDDAELIRSTVYTFRSANARDWRSGRVLLAGDAAHLMPPFLGQGMCSGVRDVTNLTWKLDLILKGLAPDVLLDSYVTERKPHVANIIEQAVGLGKISCTVDVEEARARDQALMSGQIPPPPPFPWIEEGVLQGGADEAARCLVGRLGPQARIVQDGVEGLADDVIGSGWQLIGMRGVALALGADAKAVIEALDIKIIELGEIKDVQGIYGDFLASAGVEAILVRPDFYVFGAVSKLVSLDEVFADLAAQILVKSVHTASTALPA